MIAAEGILTSRGGKTSHAAVVARGMGKTCVCGAEELDVDTKGRRFTARGDVSSRKATSSPSTAPPAWSTSARCPSCPRRSWSTSRATLDPESDDAIRPGPGRAPADAARRRERAGCGVRANSDTPEDSERARPFGAQGIGLCRTEHMFLGERRQLVERLILADSDDEREQALRALLPLQRDDFVGIFEAMDGLPVTVRLLDPPLHEFLPDLTELSVRVALAEARGEDARERPAAAAGRAPAARAEPDARPARRPARPGRSRACSRCRCARSPRRPRERKTGWRRPTGRDHDPARRRRAGARGHPRRGRAGPRRRRRARPAWTSTT